MLTFCAASMPAAFVIVSCCPCCAEYEESVEQFIRRNLGAEVFERLIEPFCSGVYAGNPSKLSMKAAFQKVRGWAVMALVSPAAAMQPLQGSCCWLLVLSHDWQSGSCCV
eukprot:GHRQ01029711.1.p1 GENE.GHRQ01029711.1~~GHRQ01029711.1.p1  ORF type:complete len:110 (-),score=45.16 GHRQ01029711.1:602-931(-)